MSLLVAVGGGIAGRAYGFVSSGAGRGTITSIKSLNEIYPNLGFIVYGGLICLAVVVVLLARNKRKRDGSKRESDGGTQVWKGSAKQYQYNGMNQKTVLWIVGILLSISGLCGIVVLVFALR